MCFICSQDFIVLFFFCLVTFLFIILGKYAFYFRPQMWYDTITNIAPFLGWVHAEQFPTTQLKMAVNGP